MLVVISSPVEVPHEATLVNALFDEGMELFHLRKPGIGSEPLKALIEKIAAVHRHRIALHQHHLVAAATGIHRLHFTESCRNEIKEDRLQKLEASHHILSTSIHGVENHETLSTTFAYFFFGPVFNSISKKGYVAAVDNDFIFPAFNDRPKPVAIGGIDARNIRQLPRKQFKGAAVLGAIWREPGKSIEQFKKIQQAWQKADQW